MLIALWSEGVRCSPGELTLIDTSGVAAGAMKKFIETAVAAGTDACRVGLGGLKPGQLL